MSRENVEAVRRQHDHFRRTGEVLAEIYGADAVWVTAREDPDAASHHGLDGIRRYFFEWTTAFEDIDIETDELIESDDRVFAWVRVKGRGGGSGTPATLEQAQVWIFREGKVVRVEEYFDREEGLAAAGLSE